MKQREDTPINPLDKRIRRQEPYRPRQEPIHSTSQKTITEEQQAGHEACHMQLKHVVPDAIRKNPRRTAPPREETLPPPVMVLGTELAVGGDDGHFANRDQEDQADGTQKPKHVVVAALVLPQVLEQEEEFDEQHCEGNQPR